MFVSKKCLILQSRDGWWSFKQSSSTQSWDFPGLDDDHRRGDDRPADGGRRRSKVLRNDRLTPEISGLGFDFLQIVIHATNNYFIDPINEQKNLDYWKTIFTGGKKDYFCGWNSKVMEAALDNGDVGDYGPSCPGFDSSDFYFLKLSMRFSWQQKTLLMAYVEDGVYAKLSAKWSNLYSTGLRHKKKKLLYSEVGPYKASFIEVLSSSSYDDWYLWNLRNFVAIEG